MLNYRRQVSFLLADTFSDLLSIVALSGFFGIPHHFRCSLPIGFLFRLFFGHHHVILVIRLPGIWEVVVVLTVCNLSVIVSATPVPPMETPGRE